MDEKKEAPKLKRVTMVYDIVDEKTWRGSGNLLGDVKDGLKSVSASIGDLAELDSKVSEELSEVGAISAERYRDLHREFVLSYL